MIIYIKIHPEIQESHSVHYPDQRSSANGDFTQETTFGNVQKHFELSHCGGQGAVVPGGSGR
jgi:hypothetical protein